MSLISWLRTSMSLDATLQEWSELWPHTTKIDNRHWYQYFSFSHHNQMFQNENFKRGRVRDLISPETQLPSDTLPVPCRALWSVHYGTWLSHSLPILTVVICLPSKCRHLFQSCCYLGWFHVDTHSYISEFTSWAWRLHGFFTFTCKPCLVFTYFSVQPSFHPQHLSHPLPKCSDGPLVFFTCQRDPAGSTKLSPCPEPVSNISAQCYKRKSHQHRDCCLCKLSVSKLEWCPLTPYCFLFLSVLLPAVLFVYYQ